MANRRVNNIQIENAQIRFRNFKGETDKYNPTGKRTFAVLLSEEQAEDLKAEGWNIKYLKARDEDEVEQAYMNVEVKYGNYPPVIKLISGRKMTELDSDSVAILDYAEIENVDLIITPYQWSMDNGTSGIKAYLKKMWVTTVVDKFEEKYANVNIDDEEVPF